MQAPLRLRWNIVILALFVVFPHSLSGAEKIISEDNNLYTSSPNCEIISYAQNQNLTKIENVLKRGVDVNCQNKFGKTALMIAAAHNSDAVPLLINYGANVNLADHQGYTALMDALQQSNISSIKYLIEAKADLEKKEGDRGTTVLMQACSRREKKEIVKLLLEAGANPNTKNNSGETALMVDLNFSGQYADILMEHGANINECSKNGTTALAIAAAYGSPETLKKILSYKPNLNITDDHMKDVMFSSVRNNNIEVIDILVKAGVTVNLQDDEGQNALLYAAYFGKVGAVKKLVELGLDINSCDYSGKPFFSLMAYNGSSSNWQKNQYSEMVSEFLQLGADINKRDKAGMTPLMHTAMNVNYNAFEVLIDAGADSSAKDPNGRTFIDFLNLPEDVDSYEKYINIAEQKRLLGADVAASLRTKINRPRQIVEDVNIIEIHLADSFVVLGEEENEELVHGKSEINARDNEGKTLLMRTCEQGGKPGTVKAILDAGADIEARDNEGVTALMFAARYSSPQTVRLLIDSGADLKAVNDTQKNVFMHACQNQDANVPAMLLPYFDVNSRQENNYTALMFAARDGCVETVKMLIDAGADIKVISNLDGGDAFLCAIKHDSIPIMQLLIDSGADVLDKRRGDRNQPLMWASVSASKKETVLFIADQISKKDSLDEYVFSALEFGFFNYGNTYATKEVIDCLKELAAKTDIDKYRLSLVNMLAEQARYISDPQKIQRLIDEGADPNGTDKSGITVLMNAAQNSNPDIIKTILKYNVAIDAGSAEKLNTALHLAVKYNTNPEIAKILIESGANIKNKQLYGNLATAAANNKSTDMIKFLKEHGLYGNSNEGSMLSDAACSANLALVRQLISAGVQEEFLSKALLDVAYNNVNVFDQGMDIKYEIIKELVNAGANVNASDEGSQSTALQRLLRSGASSQTIKFLVEKGADVNVKDKWKCSPLLIAAAEDNIEAVQTLITAGANLEDQDQRSDTPILISIKNNRLNNFKLLASSGAKIDESNSYALLSAALLGPYKNKNEMLEALLGAGVNINAVNKDGQTILMNLCRSSRDISLIQLVLDSGANISIKDKRGNNAHYYLQQNLKLRDKANSLNQKQG